MQYGNHHFNATLGAKRTNVLIPTVERPAFYEAMLIAKSMGSRPSRDQVRAWASAMKRALV